MACHDPRMGRIVLILIVLLVTTDAYLWHGGNTQMAMETPNGLAGDLNDQIARHLQPHH